MITWRKKGALFAFAALVLGSSLIVHSSPAHAAAGLSIEISPLPILLVPTPGTSTTSDLRMQNIGTGTERLKITLLKVLTDNEGNVSLVDPGPSDEWVSWIHFSQTHFEAEPHVWQTIKMTINVPKNAAFGYYFAVAYSKENESIDTKAPNLLGKVATFVIMEVYAPGAKKAGNIGKFTSTHWMYEYLPADFQVKINSTGNISIIPHGDIFIEAGKGGGKNIGDVPINSGGGRVLPNSARIFMGSWADGFPHYEAYDKSGKPHVDKKGHLKPKLIWDITKIGKFRFGHYTAHLFMIYDDGQHDVPMESTLSFWVIPWRLILIFLAIVMLIIFSFYSGITNAGRRLRRRR